MAGETGAGREEDAMQPTDPFVYARGRIAAESPHTVWPFDPDAVRAQLDAVLGGPLGWERADPEPQIEASERGDGFTRARITFWTRPGLRACGFLLLPDVPSGAGVVCLPGHGIGADAVAGVVDDDYQAQFGVQCVRRGLTTLVLEQVSFGRRRDAQAAALGGGTSSCVRDSMAALMLGETVIGWRAFDAQRALDLLAARPEVDARRLGTLGISGGGLTSLFTAALDPRVAVCGVSGYFCTYEASVLAVDHCVDNFAPGLWALCEMPELCGLIAPRFLLVESGSDDPIFPLSGVDAAVARAQEIYADTGVPDHVAAAIFPGGHRFDGTALLPALVAALAAT